MPPTGVCAGKLEGHPHSGIPNHTGKTAAPEFLECFPVKAVRHKSVRSRDLTRAKC